MDIMTFFGWLFVVVFACIGVTTVFELTRIGLKAIHNTDPENTVRNMLNQYYGNRAARWSDQ